MGYKPSFGFFALVPCIRKTWQGIIFLLDPLIKLKNTKRSLVGEGAESFPVSPVISAILPNVKVCLCSPCHY